MEINNSYSFLMIGKTQESTEAQEFKRYIGLASSFVMAVNPNKKELEAIYGHEMANEPEYVVDTDNGKEARITFIVKTDPETNNGIEMLNRVMFTLRNAPAYSKDQSKVQVIDKYGNTVWANTENAKAGNKLLSAEGKSLKIDDEYRMCCVGEADLVGFLKPYLCVQDVFKYVNGSWVKAEKADDGLFALEHIKDYFSGDFSEIKGAIEMQPNNKVKLLYGIRTKEDGKQYQAVATRNGMVLTNSAGSQSIARLEKELQRAKDTGSYATTDFRIQELAEYSVQPTNLEAAPASSTDAFDAGSSDSPWD